MLVFTFHNNCKVQHIRFRLMVKDDELRETIHSWKCCIPQCYYNSESRKCKKVWVDEM
jgi:hypothetical protein